MLSWFERLIDPYKDVPIVQPPDKLGAYYRHYIRPVWWVYALIMVFGLLGSLIEVSLVAFVGQIVDLAKSAANPAEFFELHRRTLLWMALLRWWPGPWPSAFTRCSSTRPPTPM